MVLSMSTWFSTAAVLPQLRAEWSLSQLSASWLTIAVQLGFVFGALVSAALTLADRLRPRRLVLLGSLGAAAANVALLGAGGIATGLPLRFAVGAFLAGVYPPALKAMSAWFRRGRGLALGVMVGALTLGSALPHLIRSLGSPPWQAVIITTSALTVLGGLVAELAATDGPYLFPSAPFDPRQIGQIVRNPNLRLASAGYFGHMWELYAMWAWFGAFSADVLPDRPSLAALLTFAVIGIGAAGSVVGGVISDRVTRTAAAGLAMALSAAAAALIGFVRSGPIGVVVVLGLVWGFWVVADSAQFSTIVTEHADQRYVGTALTVQLAMGFVLTVFTIFLVPVVRDATSWGWAFLLLVPGPALGVMAMVRLGLRPAPAPAPASATAAPTPVFVSPFF
ncbi:MAG: MFS transporter [Acidimicrobiales bacterium]|nr:MFS transporter [Acidimicrobiales bacterium]